MIIRDPEHAACLLESRAYSAWPTKVLPRERAVLANPPININIVNRQPLLMSERVRY